MRTRTTKWASGLGALCIAAMLACVHASNVRRVEALRQETSQPVGRFTALQIIDHSRPLALQMGDVAPGSQMRATPTTASDGSGVPVKLWEVECLDVRGRTTATFTWNADSGELMLYCDADGSRKSRPEGKLSAAEAAQSAWHWIREVSTRGDGGDWKQSGHLQRTADAWAVLYRSPGGVAIMSIGIDSGLPTYYVVRGPRAGRAPLAVRTPTRSTSGAM